MTERLKVARLACVGLGFAAGIATASLAPGIPQTVRKLAGLTLGPGTVQSPDTAAPPRDEGSKAPEEKQAVVSLTDEQLTEAHIDLAQVESGTLTHRIIVPGTIIPVADRIARVAVKLSGTVAELRKNIGDPVTEGEVLAILESREVADAKSEYLAARLSNELQQTLFQRDKML